MRSGFLVPKRLRQLLKPEAAIDNRLYVMRGQKLDQIGLILPASVETTLKPDLLGEYRNHRNYGFHSAKKADHRDMPPDLHGLNRLRQRGRPADVDDMVRAKPAQG